MQDHKDTKKRAVVLLSGGLDSATVAAWLKREGYSIIALSVDYGQRHFAELGAARELAALIGVEEHLTIPLDLGAIGASALTDPAIEVPKQADPSAPVVTDIPATYVPARNILFLSLALGLAEARGAQGIGIGVNALDYSGYPDCRPEFIAAFERVANLATRVGVEGGEIKLLTPLQDLSKVEIMRMARQLGVPVSATLSCYDPQAEANGSARVEPCGQCDACRLRVQAEAKLPTWELRQLDGVEEIVDLRHHYLRQGQPRDSAHYPDIDDLDTTAHLAVFVDDALAGCATMHSDISPSGRCQLRIRGMAVEEGFRGQGLGAALVRWCQQRALSSGDGIWCNARIRAVSMYARCGFEIVSDEFEIEKIGPHYRMEWKDGE